MFLEEGSVLSDVVAGRVPTVLALSGQDPDWRDALGRATSGRPEIDGWVRSVLAELERRLDSRPDLSTSLALAPEPPGRWLDPDPADAAGPGDGVERRWAASASARLVGTTLGQLAAVRALGATGAGPGSGFGILTGHSSGLITAWAVARHGDQAEVDPIVDVLLALAVTGEAITAHRWSTTAHHGHDDGPAPMLAVSGATEPALRALLADAAAPTDRPTPEIGLQNAWDRFVLSGDPVAIDSWRRTVASPNDLRTEALSSPVPFHHPALADATRRAAERIAAEGLALSGPLSVPLVDPRDGTELTGGDLTERLLESLCTRPVRWADTLVAVVDRAAGPPVVVDPGPATTTARMTERSLRGTGATVLALGDADDLRAASLAAERPAPTSTYRDFAPRVARSTSGRPVLRTRHTDWSGRSPVVLAGMTPTTVDAAIVAAAANAGHVAELAGGGQVTAEILAERVDELTERLEPGMEVVFNALHLDPYLWGLHLGRDRTVLAARRAGAPICGVTVSAGIPDLDDAVALLDELVTAGIWLNAFKPGDEDGVRRVLAIADATPHRIWLHLEGGLAGGHHAWSDLEQVLVATYDDIRRRPNVALAVGGGVGDGDRAAELLLGTWARRHCGIDMPVDAVLVGTAAMATAESTASPSVKAALVAAAGTDGAVHHRTSRGGVTSGRSGLGADIHYLDNRAARVAAMLEEVAGDAAAVTERRDEIAEALAGTAKPYFGDPTEMTYLEALERFVELTARGRNGRYEDGRWFDRTHRRLFADLLHRWESRCSPVDEGELRSIFADLDVDPTELDDPAKALERFARAYPIAATTDVEPSDAAHLLSLCDRPGKPVPFVVAIDAEVRRRYLADSLWQAHSDLWEAEEVLVIPGPVAVAGITRSDEPVADLLDRFHTAAARAAGARTSGSDGETAPSAVEVLAGLPTVVVDGVTVPSPILRMAAGSSPAVDDTTEGTRWSWTVSSDETLTLSGSAAPLGTQPTAVGVELRWPALPGADGDGRLGFTVRVHEHHGVPIAVVDGDSWRRAQAGLLAMVERAATTAAARARALAPDGDERPRDGSMVRVWPDVFGALRAHGAADGMVRLVHLRHRVSPDRTEHGDESEHGDGAAPAAATVEERWSAAGRELRTCVRDGSTLVEDTFLVRRVAGDPPADRDVPSTPAAPGRVPTPRRTVGRSTRRAPGRSDAFALLSGDANPLHRSDLVGRLAGLPGRIVHGMWTDAAARSVLVDEVLDGAAERIEGWDLRFVDVVEPDDDITVTLGRVAVQGGRQVLEVDVRVDDRPVALGEAVVAPPRTAYVFPGQGIQHRGMGREARDRSEAAREVWERAEAFCRRELGFSLLDVVDRNPTEIELTPALGDRSTLRHPDGVIHLTQFTQVAMATLAASQVAELREAGVFDDDAVLAGHSVGEYNALAAIGGVLPLEAVLGVVWARGSSMHGLVERDDRGRSRYRLAVVRPHLARDDEGAPLGPDDATAVVAAVEADTGELCEVVNHNLRGRQYAVAGTTTALAELQRRLGAGSGTGRAPYLEVPGIDVPFHSRALAAGVPEFRDHLDRALPDEIDPARLVGRYVPNLYPVPFRLDRDYVEGIAAVCDGAAATEILDDWEALASRPGRLTRQILVELLAWQFASPVRWIETTDVMLAPRSTSGGTGLGVQRIVEVGVGSAPTLANLAKAAVAAVGHPAEVLHVELDEAQVRERTEDPAAAADEADTGSDDGAPVDPAPAAAPVVAQVDPSDAAADVEDLPVSLDEAVPALLAFSAGLRPDQIGSDSIDQLVDGASSRRNQVLMDLGRELGIGAVDGVHEVPLPELLARVGEHVRGHRHPGPVLAAMVDSAVAAAAGRRGASPARVAERVRSTWGLGEGWVDRCRLEVALGTRDGTSRRGGPLATLDAEDLDELVDAALGAAAERRGVTLSRPSAPTDGGGVGGAAVADLVRGVADAVSEAAAAARAALAAGTGVELTEAPVDGSPGAVDLDDRAELDRLVDLDAEHGVERHRAVRSTFAPERVQVLASGVAWARADLDRLVHDPPTDPRERADLVRRLARFTGSDERFDAAVSWYRSGGIGATEYPADAEGDDRQPRLDDDLRLIARGRADDDVALAVGGSTVVVSGASPRSIGEQVVAALLGSGATVVALTSNLDPDRRRTWRDLERRHGGPGARLFVVPANLASFRDVDAVLDWLHAPDPAAVGPLGHPGRPDVIVPFAAPAVLGDAADAGARQEVELRVMLLGVERLVAGAAERHDGTGVLTAVLPLSPNHGLFGGDGAYGHAKAGLEVLATRRAAESSRWGGRCRTVGVEIGWVRGTGLMGAHDALVPAVEESLGISTHSAEEVGARIAALCVSGDEPGDDRVDLTGGLGSVDAADLAALVRGRDDTDRTNHTNDDTDTDDTTDTDGTDRTDAVTLRALPGPRRSLPARPAAPAAARAVSATAERTDLRDMVVLCGVAEVGPWGTSGTRADAERHRELLARTVLELAVHCGLIEWDPSPRGGGWVDAADGERVDEADVAERYRDRVVERCGIRRVEQSIEGELRVFTERPVVVAVGSPADARALVAATPGARIDPAGPDDATTVTIPAGAALWASHPVPLPRSVTAPLPDGMDPVRFGVPAEMASSIDPIAAWNLATTAEAFRDAGTDPEELLAAVPASRVGCTQGTGMGGMDSIRTIHLAPRRPVPHANDVLQEALGNVAPAHAVQSFVGGAGPMIHPVAACATAGVSLELALDLIRADKADVVVGGGFDDLGPEGIVGFAEMSATADDSRLTEAGFSPREMSRPGDRSRAGFVESQGGGSFLVCRASVAADLGLPVRAVVVFAASHGDGLQTSIPAPGPGALGAVGLDDAGRPASTSSPLGRALSRHGLGADDVAVVSKHDTSTRANDPNEAEIHERIQVALGRSAGNPLRVVSQKALTGHAKGGSALWQIAGLCDVFDDGVVPGNPNLDSVDPDVQPGASLVVDDRPLRLVRPPRAALFTSLGFGHVSVVGALAHPDVFHEALAAERGEEAAESHAATAATRRRERDRRRRAALHGRDPAFRRRRPRATAAEDRR